MRQLVGWMAYHSLEPFGPVESVVAMILDGLTGKKTGRSRAGRGQKGKKQSADEMKAIFDQIFDRGGSSARKKGKK